MSDWEYSDESCPKCGEQLAWQRCDNCENGVWEDTDCNGTEYDSCDNCDGRGHYEWCRECGWDNIFGCFLSPKYEKEWLEKQQIKQDFERGES